MKQGKLWARFLAFVCIFALMISMVPTALAAKYPYETVSMDDVNLRKRANTTSTILKKIKEGDTVTILGATGSFYRVKFDGKEGYAMKAFIDGTDPSADAPLDPANARDMLSLYSYPYDTIVLQSVKMRKTAETEGEVIRTLLPDTIVVKVEESQLACQVSAGAGGVWYINAEGRVLGSSLDNFAGQIVELRGVSLQSPKVGDQVEAAEGAESSLEAALAVLKQMDGTGLIEKVTVVNTEKPFDIELLCGDQYQILLGGSDELEYKIQYLQVVLDGLDPYQAGTIDLTFDQDRVAVFSQWE